MTTPCRGDDRFTSDDPFEREAAKALCNGCPVAAACGAGAEERGETWGVWGGVDRAPKPPTMATPDEPQGHIRVQVYALAAHGTRQRYQQGCRCGPCTAANTAEVAKHRKDHEYDAPKPERPKAEPLSMFAEIPAVTSRRRVNA